MGMFIHILYELYGLMVYECTSQIVSVSSPMDPKIFYTL